MPLLSLWQTNPETVSELNIEQIVSNAGDGKLSDNSSCSSELKQYLSLVTSNKLASYLEHCLESPFNNSGYVLQDIVNELGRRLNYNVTNGRYKGVKNAVGYDGIWKAPISESNHIVVEVKSTDAYRISLDTIANYRQELLKSETINQPSSILIVVGRDDTGELESQIRGSRHAWDIRLIGADALIKLVKLKESIGDVDTEKKIRSVLVPMEYTKLDTLIDVMFTTVKDVENVVQEEKQSEDLFSDEVIVDDQSKQTTKKSIYEFTDSKLLEQKRIDIIDALGKREQVTLIKNSQAKYWDSTHKVRSVITISKKYEKGASSQYEHGYWYAYHPNWNTFLQSGDRSYFVLGCMDLNIAFVIPQKLIETNLEHFNITPKKEKRDMIWHISTRKTNDGQYLILLPKKHDTLSINEYILELK